MKLEKALLTCSGKLSQHATFCLLTLLLLCSLTLGLWWAHPTAVNAAPGKTRGSASMACHHVSVAFAPSLSVEQLSRLLRAEDARILYGPDEFGEYQLRIGSSTPVAQAIASLQQRKEIASMTEHPQCE